MVIEFLPYTVYACQVDAGLVSDTYQITIKQSYNKGKQVMMYVLHKLCVIMVV